MILGPRFGFQNPWKGAQEAKKVRIARAPGPYGGPRGVQSSPGRVRSLQKSVRTSKFKEIWIQNFQNLCSIPIEKSSFQGDRVLELLAFPPLFRLASFPQFCFALRFPFPFRFPFLTFLSFSLGFVSTLVFPALDYQGKRGSLQCSLPLRVG